MGQALKGRFERAHEEQSGRDDPDVHERLLLADSRHSISGTLASLNDLYR